MNDFTEAIRLDPKYTLAYYTNRGLAYGNTGNCDKAVSDYTEAIRFDANYASAYLSR